MSCQIEVFPIRPNFPWTITIVDQAPDPANLFAPAGATFEADIRHEEGGAILATISTGSGVTRIDDNTLEIVFSPAVTATLTPGRMALFDFVRTDTAPPTHTNIGLSIPVKASITEV